MRSNDKHEITNLYNSHTIHDLPTLDTKILVTENFFTEINFTENFSQKATILQFKAKILVGENFSQQAIP